MSKKSNVHPDHYKTDGRDRPDDAARARLNRAIAAKSLSRERPDRMGKRFYFERPEPPFSEEAPEPSPRKKSAARKPAVRKRPAARKKAAAGAARRRPRTKAAAPRRVATAAKRGSPARRKPSAKPRPAKKR